MSIKVKLKKYIGILALLIVCTFMISTAAQANPVSGHDDVLTMVQDPTCLTAGVRTYTCSRCGRIRTEPGAPALGHDFVLAFKTMTCGEVSVRTYACSRCDQKRTETGDIVEHDYILTIQAPTCETAGLQIHTCSRCDYTRIEPGDAALGHRYMLMTQASTCEAAGLRIHTCVHCRSRRTEPGAVALGHDYILTIQDPTCEEDGERTYICSRCDYARIEPGETALGHNFLLTIQVPTCSAAGLRTYTCSRCGYGHTEAGEPVIPCVFGVWDTETPADEENPGMEIRSCGSCGRHEERVVPVMGHPPVFDEPIFNEIDIIVGGISLSLFMVFGFLVVLAVMTVTRERKTYKAYLKKQRTVELEDREYDFR